MQNFDFSGFNRKICGNPMEQEVALRDGLLEKLIKCAMDVKDDSRLFYSFIRCICNCCTGNSAVSREAFKMILKSKLLERLFSKDFIELESFVLLYNLIQSTLSYFDSDLPCVCIEQSFIYLKNYDKKDLVSEKEKDAFFFCFHLVGKFLGNQASLLERYFAEGPKTLKMELLVDSALIYGSKEIDWKLPVSFASKVLVQQSLIPEIDGKLNFVLVSKILTLFDLTLDRYDVKEREELGIGGLAVVSVGLLKLLFVQKDKVKDEIPLQISSRVKLVKMIASLAYKSRPCQDELALLGVLPLILSLTKTDPENPLMREWSVFALRNLLENHPENQEFISNIKPVP